MMSKIRIVRKIEETKSLMTPVKEITFRINRLGGEFEKEMDNGLLRKKGILLADIYGNHTLKIIFDSSKFEEERLCELIEN